MMAQQEAVGSGNILNYVVDVLTNVTAEWDVGEISAETRLGGLGLESISLVYLIAEIQQHYNLQDRLFTKLRTAGIDIRELRVADLAEFVREILASGRVPPGGARV